MAAKLLDLKVRGLTNADATIATTPAEFWDDGSFHFVIGGVRYIYTGNDPVVNKMLTTVFAGATGLDARKLSGGF